MSRQTRDRTAETLPKPSRETTFSGANGDREMFIFPVQLTTSRIGNLARLVLTLLYQYVMTIHTLSKVWNCSIQYTVGSIHQHYSLHDFCICRYPNEQRGGGGVLPDFLFCCLFPVQQTTSGIVCMYVCIVITYSRVCINRVRLPILLVVSWTGKNNIPLFSYAPENLFSRDGCSRPVPRQPAHSPYLG